MARDFAQRIADEKRLGTELRDRGAGKRTYFFARRDRPPDGIEGVKRG
jgi:hypothetical protein